jgi:phospholipid transport system substrate-binding protein
MTNLVKHFARLVLAAAVWSGSAASAASDPMDMLRSGVAEVLSVVYGDSGASGEPLSTRIRPVLEKHFDLESVTRRAVGPAWRNMSEADRRTVTDLFSRLVLRTYADSFEPGEPPEIRYGTAVNLAATRRELPTTIVYAGKNYSVSYRVEQAKDGWRIYDVVIEGVSMIANYRAQFEPIVQRGGAPALIKSLEDNLAKVPRKP